MIIVDTTTAPQILWRSRWLVVAAAVITAAVEVANDFVDLERPIFSFAAIGLLVTALSISLVFRVNEAYARWWEARSLWGTIVNESRSWSRQVMTMVGASEGDRGAQRRRLIYRQIAYANALRLRLLKETEVDALAPFLDPAEIAALEKHANPPIALLQTQSEELAALRAEGAIDAISLHRLDTTLSGITDAQGGCDRIKGTDFPDRLAYFTRISAWLMAILIPVLVLRPDNRFDVVEFVFVRPY